MAIAVIICSNLYLKMRENLSKTQLTHKAYYMVMKIFNIESRVIAWENTHATI